MGTFLDPQILIPLILAGVAALGYYAYLKIGKKYPKKGQKPTSKINEPKLSDFKPAYAQVFDNTEVVPCWYWKTIPGEEVGRILLDYSTLGIQQDSPENKKAYQLVKERKNNVTFYRPIDFPILKEEDDPTGLNYDAEHPSYRVILKDMLTEEKNFMQKYGQVLWWSAVIGFIIFMMVSG